MNAAQFHQWRANQVSPHQSSCYQRKPLIMGIVNVTPDSFSDGGRFHATPEAICHAEQLIEAGADLLDIGGESSRPGAYPVSTEEELARVIPVIQAIRQQSEIALSIDTHKAAVMKAAVEAGATLINDIQALSSSSALETAAELQVPVVLMHAQGTPDTMQDKPSYPDGILVELSQFFQARIQACEAAGLMREKLILDPGFGFGKTVAHNLTLTKEIKQLHQHRCPILLGVSRKSTLGKVLSKPVGERLAGGLALAVYAALQGVSIIRTHDVNETKQALDMLDAVVKEEWEA